MIGLTYNKRCTFCRGTTAVFHLDRSINPFSRVQWKANSAKLNTAKGRDEWHIDMAMGMFLIMKLQCKDVASAIWTKRTVSCFVCCPKYYLDGVVFQILMSIVVITPDLDGICINDGRWETLIDVRTFQGVISTLVNRSLTGKWCM